MASCLTDPTGFVLLNEACHFWRPRVKSVVGQLPHPPRSPLGVLAQRRQAHEVDPRTNRAICQAKEEGPEIPGGLADDGNDADNLRKQACLVRGTLTARTAVVVLCFRREEIRHTHSIYLHLDWEGAHADQNGRNGTACRAHPRPQSEGGLLLSRSLCVVAVKVTIATVLAMEKETIDGAKHAIVCQQLHRHLAAVTGRQKTWLDLRFPEGFLLPYQWIAVGSARGVLPNGTGHSSSSATA
jgi:hypothetical protein